MNSVDFAILILAVGTVLNSICILLLERKKANKTK